MNGYREVFSSEEEISTDPGKLFYIITQKDIGKRFIRTPEIIQLADVIGYVQLQDVGRRLYRVPTDGGIEGQSIGYIWQAESDAQRDKRLAAEK